VLVTVEYKIDPENRASFLNALMMLADQRRRDGAFQWGIFEDSTDSGRFVETFLIESWIEHLRQHERVTEEGRMIQDSVNAFHIGDTAPIVSHLIAA
jgi:Transmembrane secretion effector